MSWQQVSRIKWHHNVISWRSIRYSFVETSKETVIFFYQKDRQMSRKDNKYVTALRFRLHWALASKQSQRCDDPSNSHLIENDKTKWSRSRMVCNPFWSDSIVFNEITTASIITARTFRWRWRSYSFSRLLKMLNSRIDALILQWKSKEITFLFQWWKKKRNK